MSVARALQILAAAYPKEDFPQPTVQLYANRLARFDEEDVMAAVSRLIDKCKWLPKISEIVEEITDANVRLPSGSEAYHMAVTMEWGALEPEIQATVRELGGTATLKRSERPELTRRAFIEVYDRRKQQTRLGYMGALPPAGNVRPMPSHPTVRALPPTDKMPARLDYDPGLDTQAG